MNLNAIGYTKYDTITYLGQEQFEFQIQKSIT